MKRRIFWITTLTLLCFSWGVAIAGIVLLPEASIIKNSPYLWLPWAIAPFTALLGLSLVLKAKFDKSFLK